MRLIKSKKIIARWNVSLKKKLKLRSPLITPYSPLLVYLHIYLKKEKKKEKEKNMRYNIFREKREYLITGIIALQLLIHLKFSNLQ